MVGQSRDWFFSTHYHDQRELCLGERGEGWAYRLVCRHFLRAFCTVSFMQRGREEGEDMRRSAHSLLLDCRMCPLWWSGQVCTRMSRRLANTIDL